MDRTQDPDRPPALFPVAFFVIAYAFAWTLWLLPLAQDRGWVALGWVAQNQTALLIAGAFGPFVAAAALTTAGGGGQALRRFLGRGLRWRIPASRLLTALLLVPLLAWFAVYIVWRQGGPSIPALAPAGDLAQLYLLIFFLGGSFQEEFGWAYAIDRLQRRWPPLAAAVLLGFIWGLWHLPLFFIISLSQHYMPLWSFLILTVMLRIIAVWIYDGSGSSILATLLFHTSLNFILNLLPLLLLQEGVTQAAWLLFIPLVGLAAAAAAISLRRQYPNALVSRVSAVT